ncbi:hypothetical protein [Persicitalea sp.]|uniref:hypothetical protein n=1 Tax=Persicitalea sp. TaxID=3100273 RepID=UPI003594052C
MKSEITLLVLFVQSICGVSGLYAQPSIKSAITVKLDSLANQMVNSGVYERVIDFGYVHSPKRYERNRSISAHNELTMFIVRFDKMEFDSSINSYIGRVFMGERYLEMSYNKIYSSITNYKNDKDGFFMMCKLYYEPRSGEFRLNIYPNYVTNICERSGNPFKGMHYNTVLCDSTDQHWQSLRYLTALSDEHSDNFSQTNDSSNVFKFLNPPLPAVNIFRQDTTYSDLPKRKRNLLRELNLRKQIKCFTVGSIRANHSGLSANSLRLKFTKYSLSEDFLDGSEYELRFLSYTEMNNDFLRLKGGLNESDSASSIFITRNPLYKSLISSFEPIDTYVPDLNFSSKINIYYVRDSLLEISQVSQGQNQKEKMRSDRLVNIKQRSQIEQKVSLPDLETHKRPLEQLPGKAQSVTSADLSDEHWIYYDEKVQNKPVKDVLVIKSPVFLRDTIPVQTENGEWLQGGIKVKFKGYTNPGDRWQILDTKSVGTEGHIVLWKKIKEIAK